MAPLSPAGDPVMNAPTAASDQVLERFESAWASGSAPSITNYLPGETDPSRQVLLEELIKIDMERRWRLPPDRADGQRLRLEDYAALFPELGSSGTLPPGLIVEEYRVRQRWGDRPLRDEYLRRFPQHARLLPELLTRLDERLAAEFSPASITAPPIALPVERPVTTVAEFAEILRRHTLLTSAQLEDIAATLDRHPTPDSLAQELLGRSWLTPYQVDQVLSGTGASLCIGSYVLLERLGEGGVGQVFKARHQRMNRVAAIKLIRPELTTDPEVLARFYREIQIIAQLDHPNVVHAYDAGPIASSSPLAGEGGVRGAFLAMEFVEGTDLSRLIKREGPLPVARAIDCVRQAALGLQHAHEKGLVHRDIKPSNLIVASGQWPVASKDKPGSSLTTDHWSLATIKILDLGLARLRPRVDGERTGSLTPSGPVIMGTLDYMAPEQAIDFHAADIRADIYSLGCTLYYLLTAEPPFSGGTLALKLIQHQQAEPPPLEQRLPQIPGGLVEVYRRMLAKLPEDRYQTPAEAAAALASVNLDGPPAMAEVGAAPPIAPVVSPVDSNASSTVKVAFAVPGAERQRRRVFLVIALSAVLLFLVGASLLWFGPSRSPPQMTKPELVVQTPPATKRSSPAPRLQTVDGTVTIRGPRGTRAGTASMELQAGETIELIGADGIATLAWPDGTQLEMGGNTVLRIDGEVGKRVRAETVGRLRFTVPRQPDAPVMVTGAGMAVQATQGRFTLGGGPDGTCLRVDEGMAEARRASDGGSVKAAAGQFVLMAPGKPFAARPITQGVRVVDDFESKYQNWGPFCTDRSLLPTSFATCKLTPEARMGQQAIRLDYMLVGDKRGGMIWDFQKLPQDWSPFARVNFWFRGTGNGVTVRFELWNDKHRNSHGTAVYDWTDTSPAWRRISIPWSAFRRQPLQGGAPATDEFTRHRMTGLGIVVVTGTGYLLLDQLELTEHEILGSP